MSINTDPEFHPEWVSDTEVLGGDLKQVPAAPAPTAPPHKGHPSQTWNYPKPPEIPLPTIGRVVHWFDGMSPSPHAAIVAFVVPGSHTVALTVCNHDGSIAGMEMVPHVKDALKGSHYWDWMEFQKGQAAKTEALQGELDRKVESDTARRRAAQAAKTDAEFDAKTKGVDFGRKPTGIDDIGQS